MPRRLAWMLPLLGMLLAPPALAQAQLEVTTDRPCTLVVNGSPQGQLSPSLPLQLPVGAGAQWLECTADNGVVRREVNITAAGLTRVVLRPSLLTRYSPQGDGILLDTLTTMQWTTRDNAADISQPDSVRYCAELDLAGRGWRLPTVSELEQIYDSSGTLASPCEDLLCGVSPHFLLSGTWYWSSDLSQREEGLAWYLAFHQAGLGSASLSAGVDGRVLCTRPQPVN